MKIICLSDIVATFFRENNVDIIHWLPKVIIPSRHGGTGELPLLYSAIYIFFVLWVMLLGTDIKKLGANEWARTTDLGLMSPTL